MSEALKQSTTVEQVTPSKAERWINLNKVNRPLREGRVEVMTADMKNDKWTQCYAPIVFYEDGELADGQHRLYAIVESGTTQTFIVVRNAPRAAGLNIDTGVARTLVDNAKLSGIDTELSNETISYARGLEYGDRPPPGKLSNSMMLEIIKRHREPAEWTREFGPRGKMIRNAPVMCAVARAWIYEQDRERLKAFGKVVGTGFSNGPADAAGIALRNYLLALPPSMVSTTAYWRDTFLKAQNCVWYFMRSRPITLVKKVGEERYGPVKGSAAAIAKKKK